MSTQSLRTRILVVVGGLAFAVGTLDPMEGSILILAGGGLLALGTWMGEHPRPMKVYWLWVFALLLVGVGALWELSLVGGVGGRTGRSMGWLLLCLPYPVGWLMAFGGIILRLVRLFTRRKPRGEVLSL